MYQGVATCLDERQKGGHSSGGPPGPGAWFKTSFPDFDRVLIFSPEELTASLNRPCMFQSKLFVLSDRTLTYYDWLSIAVATAAKAFTPNVSSPVDFAGLVGRVLRARLGASTTKELSSREINLHVTYAEGRYDSIYYPFDFHHLPPSDSENFFVRTVVYFPSKNDEFRFLHTQFKIIALA